MKGNASYLCATHLAEVRFLEHILLLGNKAKNPSLGTSFFYTPNNVVEESGRWWKLFWVVEEDGDRSIVFFCTIGNGSRGKWILHGSLCIR